MEWTAAAKQLTDGGIVGVLVVLALWWTQRGHPRLMKTLDKYAEAADIQRKDSIAAQTAQQVLFLAQFDQQRKDYLDVLRVFRENSSQDAVECRQERAGMLKAFREERAEDRLARHSQSNEFQKMIAEMYRGHFPESNADDRAKS